MFLDCRERISVTGFTDIQRAAMFYVLVKTGFGASLRTFGCNKKRLNTDNFADIEARLDGVVIENKDFEDLITRQSGITLLNLPRMTMSGSAEFFTRSRADLYCRTTMTSM